MVSPDALTAPHKHTPGPAGYVGGSRFKADLIGLTLPLLSAPQQRFLHAQLVEHELLDAAAADLPDEPLRHFFELLRRTHWKLLKETRFSVPEMAELIEVQLEKRLVRAAVPRLLFHGGLSAELFLNLANGFARGTSTQVPLGPWLTRLRQQLYERDRPSLNALNFVDAACELGMPIIELPARQMQIGYGNRAGVLKGSITQKTSSIGVATAKQKSLCNALLVQAGFPVAEGAAVANLEQARQCARQFGYPVVVKPADRDGGEAVSCDIRTDDELEEGYRRARDVSANVIVERHIAGRDFRLLFHEGELLARIERRPGGVTGNGIASVAELVAQMNADPSRHGGRDATLYPLEFDAEAELMLRRGGMTADSVPSEGEFVQLRRAANFALGGTVARIEEEIHPDNLDLCRRAMRLLRLDLAGLDLLMPDITRSWREGGGVICEVNAQPFIGSVLSRNVYAEILRELVPGTGRIPLVLFVGELDQAAIEALVARVPQLAVVDADGARLNGHPLTISGMPWLKACEAALLDPQVGAALFVLPPSTSSPLLSPVDRFAAAYLLDWGGTVDGEDLPSDLIALLRRAEGNVAAPAKFEAALTQEGLKPRSLAIKRLIDDLVAALS